MGALLPALASLAAPILARVLIALGFSVLTVGGVAVALSQVKQYVLLGLGQGPAAAIQIAGLAGVWVSLGFVFGAMTFVVTLWGLTQATKIVGAGGG